MSLFDNEKTYNEVRLRNTRWHLPESATPVQKHDIVCFVQGAKKPTLVRLFKDHFVIIVIAATLKRQNLNNEEVALFVDPPTEQTFRNLLLVWDLIRPEEDFKTQEDYKTLTESFNLALAGKGPEERDLLDDMIGMWNNIMILDDLGQFQKASERIIETKLAYATAFGKELSQRTSRRFGRTLLSFAAREGHEDVVKLLLQKIDPNLKDGAFGWTALWWAAQNKQMSVVELLLKTTKVNANSKNRDYSEALLSWAARRGDVAIVKKLLEHPNVNVNSRNWWGGTPLWLATRRGRFGIVRLLCENVKIDLNSRDNDGLTPVVGGS